MIKLVLLTGFLGAGKTTMLKEILEAYQDCKVGVIVNEFGEINIDARLVNKGDIQMAELSNGSIFCACIKDKFVDSLIELSFKDLDYVFIEASGLADPANMKQIVEGIKNNVLNQYEYKGSICIIDGESFEELYEVLPAITSQLEFCGAVLINKGDLINEEQLKNILEIIDTINSNAAIYITSYCRIDVKEVIDNIKINDSKARDSVNTYESRPATFILKGLKQLPYDDLKEFLETIAKDTYRIKGFADTDHGIIEISAVGENIYLNQWDDEFTGTQIVVISSVGFKMMSILTRTIKTKLDGFLRI